MGSNETATATTGGPRVIGVFDGDGAPLPLLRRRWCLCASRCPQAARCVWGAPGGRRGASSGGPRAAAAGARPSCRPELVLARSVIVHATAAQSPRAFRCGVVAPCTPSCQLRAVVRSKLQCLCALQIRMAAKDACFAERNRPKMIEAAEYGGVGVCTCMVPTLGDPRETSWAGIDRIKPARRPVASSASAPRIKKIPFSAPGTCHIDLFGPVAN
jgi:hypothetical protein